MTAITTKYIGPSNVRGSRVKATVNLGQASPSVTIEWNNAFGRDHNHDTAAKALCVKLGYVDNSLVSSSLGPNENVYIIDTPYNHIYFTEKDKAEGRRNYAKSHSKGTTK